MRTLLTATAALLLLGCAHTAPPKKTTASSPEHVHHGIDYIEIHVTDLSGAKAFYAAAFGWEFNDYGPDYAGIRRPGGEGEMGGLAPVDAVRAGGPLVILYSLDLEASAMAVLEAGGAVTVDIFEFPGGRRFQFTDPSGNELAVWSDG